MAERTSNDSSKAKFYKVSHHNHYFPTHRIFHQKERINQPEMFIAEDAMYPSKMKHNNISYRYPSPIQDNQMDRQKCKLLHNELQDIKGILPTTIKSFESFYQSEESAPHMASIYKSEYCGVDNIEDQSESSFKQHKMTDQIPEDSQMKCTLPIFYTRPSTFSLENIKSIKQPNQSTACKIQLPQISENYKKQHQFDPESLPCRKCELFIQRPKGSKCNPKSKPCRKRKCPKLEKEMRDVATTEFWKSNPKVKETTHQYNSPYAFVPQPTEDKAKSCLKHRFKERRNTDMIKDVYPIVITCQGSSKLKYLYDKFDKKRRKSSKTPKTILFVVKLDEEDSSSDISEGDSIHHVEPTEEDASLESIGASDPCCACCPRITQLRQGGFVRQKFCPTPNSYLHKASYKYPKVFMDKPINSSNFETTIPCTKHLFSSMDTKPSKGLKLPNQDLHNLPLISQICSHPKSASLDHVLPGAHSKNFMKLVHDPEKPTCWACNS